MFGYARVSTADQDLRVQIQALEDYGCDSIYQEKESGSKARRHQLDLVKKQLRSSDTLVVWKIDRLGRNVLQLWELMKFLETKGVHFVSLNDPIDITNAQGKLVFTMIAALAEMESDLASERTKAGMAAARRAGKFIGSKMYRDRISGRKRDAIEADIANPDMSMHAISQKHGMAALTLRRNWAKELREAGKLRK